MQNMKILNVVHTGPSRVWSFCENNLFVLAFYEGILSGLTSVIKIFLNISGDII